MPASADSSPAPAVVLGGVGAALSITRSLGRAGVPVHVLGDSSSLAAGSRYCTEFVDLGCDTGVVGRWLEWLRTEAPRGSVVLTCGDDGLELVAANAERLREWGLRPQPTAGVASLAMLDKDRTAALAAAAGVPVPRTWSVADPAQLAAIDSEVSYPCALKPLHSHLFSRVFGDRKLFVAATREELAAALERTREHGLEMQVTEIVAGPDSNVCAFSTYLEEDGEPLFELTRRKLRSYPIHFGVGSYHETRPDPEVAELGLRFCRAAGLRGLASVEFKRDGRDGGLRLIECNHRFVAATELICRAGVDLPLLVYRRTLGEPVEAGTWRPGVRLWMPGIDRRSAAESHAAGELSWPRWLASLLHRPLYTQVFSLGDLGPSLLNMRRRVGRKLRGLASRG